MKRLALAILALFLLAGTSHAALYDFSGTFNPSLLSDQYPNYHDMSVGDLFGFPPFDEMFKDYGVVDVFEGLGGQTFSGQFDADSHYFSFNVGGIAYGQDDVSATRFEDRGTGHGEDHRYKLFIDMQDNYRFEVFFGEDGKLSELFFKASGDILINDANAPNGLRTLYADEATNMISGYTSGASSTVPVPAAA